jgi:DNA-binding GntR family transcriptional regulator
MPERRRLDHTLVERVKDTPSLSDAAYKSIRAAITNGTLEPGAWLREQALARELGVSRITVRDALARLVAEGLAVRVPPKGVRAVVLPLEELQDIYEMRALLEGMAVELAAARISTRELARMRRLASHLPTDARPESIVRAQQENREFHWIAISASGRHHLTRVLSQLLDLTFSYLRLSGSQEEGREAGSHAGLRHGHANAPEALEMDFEQFQALLATSAKEHMQLVEALEARDGKRARELVMEHMQHTLDWLRARSEGQQVRT